MKKEVNQQLGQTNSGLPLLSGEVDGGYYLDQALVALKNNSGHYFCLPSV